ncbi:MAG: hypothetical protein V7739_06885 [Motiliproteus sp.]
MKKLILFYLIVIANISFANDEMLIEDSKLIAQLDTIQQNLDNVSTSVMSCIDSGKDHSSCLCESKEMIIKFNDSVETLFRENQKLKKHDLVRFKSIDGSWVTQSLQGLLKQANAGTPKCT